MSTPSKADPQRVLMALDALNRQKIDAAAKDSLLANSTQQEADLKDRLRDMLAHQGAPIDEEAISEAVRATREPAALVYDPPVLSAPIDWMVRAYLARAIWMKYAVMTAVLGVSVAVGSVSVNAYQQTQVENAAKAHASAVSDYNLHVSQLGQQTRQLTKILSAWPNSIGQRLLKTQAQQDMGNLMGFNTSLTDQSLSTKTPKDLAVAQSTLAKAQELAKKINSQVKQSNVLASLENQANDVANQTTDPTWPELAPRQQASKQRFVQSLNSADVASAQKALEDLNTFAQAGAMRSNMRQLTSDIPSVGQTEAKALQTIGEAALLDGDLARAHGAQTQLIELSQKIAQSYTLKIVNEPGVNTGFWRQADGRDVYNYYVVVDALDDAGRPVKLHLVNEENNSTTFASRFAVRVPESFFEGVKADKKDNGLLDKPVLGTKKSGSIKPTYVTQTDGGVITSW